MKVLTLILSFIFSLPVVAAQEPSNTRDRIITKADTSAQLQLSTTLMNQRYSVEDGSRLLRLTLNLTYTNIGNRPILLDKKSLLIYRKMLSRSLKAASARKYEYDASSSLIDVSSMQAAGFRMDGTPDKEAFTTLKPGESYSLRKELDLRLYDGKKDTEDFLRPGTYFLQVRVATWYYFADPDEYRQKWNDDGYLWSENMTSVPMRVEVEKARD